MILALEILLTIAGLYMLFAGKSWEKTSRGLRHWQFRLLGAFMLSIWPVAIFVSICIGILYAIAYPNRPANVFKQDTHWVFFGLEVGLVLLYAIIAHYWHRAIVRRVLRESAALEAPPTELEESPSI